MAKVGNHSNGRCKLQGNDLYKTCFIRYSNPSSGVK